MIRTFYHIKVVFYHDDGIAAFDKLRQHTEELLYIGEVKSRGRLVQDIEGGDPVSFLESSLEKLYPLGLAARECGRGLAEFDVPEPHINQDLELCLDGGDGGEKSPSPGSRSGQAHRQCSCSCT